MNDLSAVKAYLIDAKEHSKFVFLIGNGGSAANAEHAAIDLLKKGIKAISLTNPAVLTALGNDIGFEFVYAEQLEVLGEGYLIAFSVSGESDDIINGVEMAQSKEMKIIGFTTPGTRLAFMSHISYLVYSEDYGKVEDEHMQAIHELCRQL